MSTSAKKRSVKKAAATVVKKAVSQESYVVRQSRTPSISSTSASHIHRLNPLHPKNRGYVEKIKKDTDAATLSAQAEASVFKDDLAERIPRAEAAEHMKFIATVAPTMTPAGSFRRGTATCNDIDVVICEPIGPVIARMSALGYIKHTFSAGAHKFSGIVKLPTNNKHRHLDIVMTTPSSYPFAMLYFTGSAKHNIILRIKAKRRGLKLNEYGLFKDDVAIPDIASERDIFTALGVEYKEPSER
jgi:DNA polymerase/3'-5' exonuclease PolX